MLFIYELGFYILYIWFFIYMYKLNIILGIRLVVSLDMEFIKVRFFFIFWKVKFKFLSSDFNIGRF